jgi:hypothetical protein
VFAFVAPPVGWPHIPVALDRAAAAFPQGFIKGPDALGLGCDTLYLGTLVVMWNETASVCVFDVKEGFVAAHAMEARRGHQLSEESREVGKGLRIGLVWGCKVCECVCVECLRWD